MARSKSMNVENAAVTSSRMLTRRRSERRRVASSIVACTATVAELEGARFRAGLLWVVEVVFGQGEKMRSFIVSCRKRTHMSKQLSARLRALQRICARQTCERSLKRVGRVRCRRQVSSLSPAMFRRSSPPHLEHLPP